MREELLVETDRLKRSWAGHDAGWLRAYLVAGVEDPRLNAQSILTRHFLINLIWSETFAGLMAEEYRFAAALRWLLDNAGYFEDAETGEAVLEALRRGSDNAEGIQIPAHVTRTFQNLTRGGQLAVPNYLEEFLMLVAQGRKPSWGETTDTFARLWRSNISPSDSEDENSPIDALTPGEESGVKAGLIRQRVLEPACGSANDFRFLHQYGIAERIDYTGFDLCRNNVENARAMFPEERFEVGNVFDIQAPDKSFDGCVVHDLFEHLSIAGLEQAVKEICRVTRNGICAGFFQMEEIAEHIVRPVDDYHWNLLSMGRTKELFAKEGFTAQVIHIDTFFAEATGGARTHNPNAYSFILRRV